MKLDERGKAQVVISSIIMLKGKEKETYASYRSTLSCTVVVVFRGLSPIIMNPLKEIRAPKE